MRALGKSLFARLPLVFALAWAGLSAAGEDEAAVRAKLGRLESRMRQLVEELRQEKERQGGLRAALRKSELAIGELRNDIRASRARLADAKARLESMRRERRQLVAAREEQQVLIERQLLAAYQMGRQGQVKVLLSQENPATLARVLAYYGYFHAARARHVERYLDTLRRIDALEPEIAATARQWEQAAARLEEQRRRLVAGRRQRQRDLARLDASIRTKDQRLARMAADQRQLEKVLRAVAQAVAAMPAPESERDFAELRGNMPWPLAGRPSNRYGGWRNDALKWQGLTIPAVAGTTVRAIHHGRVAFADWLRGSGLLLIIDHGAGYMSLYAHNESLLREVGERVATGAAISTVGNSGGQRQAALYFEIRERGKPINPLGWLRQG